MLKTEFAEEHQMTKEEQQAYFAQREQELLAKCRIRSEKQFISECKKADIHEDWYAFDCDRSKPVSMDDDTVYYRKSGETSVSYPFQRWDIAFRELLRYKEEYEWEATGAPYRITSVNLESNDNIIVSFGNTMTIEQCRFSEHPEQEMLDDGWVYDHYDQYMGYSVYHKTVPNNSVMSKTFIVFTFKKRTDKRDAETFGFAENTYLRGSYRYPVPEDLHTRIVSERDFPDTISNELREILIQRLAKNLIEDEYEDLRAFQKGLQSALNAACDPKLSEREQKDAFVQALRCAEKGHPAVDNYKESRCYIVTHNNLHLAYDRAGLP